MALALSTVRVAELAAFGKSSPWPYREPGEQDAELAYWADWLDAQQKIQVLRELFADAPAVGKTALENVLRELTSDASETPPPPVESARPFTIA